MMADNLHIRQLFLIIRISNSRRHPDVSYFDNPITASFDLFQFPHQDQIQHLMFHCHAFATQFSNNETILFDIVYIYIYNMA
jgi:hypothetical protein